MVAQAGRLADAEAEWDAAHAIVKQIDTAEAKQEGKKYFGRQCEVIALLKRSEAKADSAGSAGSAGAASSRR